MKTLNPAYVSYVKARMMAVVDVALSAIKSADNCDDVHVACDCALVEIDKICAYEVSHCDFGRGEIYNVAHCAQHEIYDAVDDAEVNLY